MFSFHINETAFVQKCEFGPTRHCIELRLEVSLCKYPHNGQRCVPSCASGGIPTHDDVIKWKHFPRYWPFVRGIDRSPVNSRRKSQ